MSRDLITVEGPDAEAFLQGQLSQDVVGLEVGVAARTLLLEPSGKLGYWLEVSRSGPASFELEIQEGHGEAIATRLERFKIRTDAVIQVLPGARPPRSGTGASTGSGTATPAQQEAERIWAGVPRMGSEIVEGVIPAELGRALIADSVSFTKGCYTGQELVARIDSRGGNVPRHLRRLLIDAGPIPVVGAELVVDGKLVGTITSVSWSDALGAAVGLAFVARTLVPPAPAELRWPGGSGRATIEDLPKAPPASGPTS